MSSKKSVLPIFARAFISMFASEEPLYSKRSRQITSIMNRPAEFAFVPPLGRTSRLLCCLLAWTILSSLGYAADLKNSGADDNSLTVWPDRQFAVDQDGNISPQQDFVHDGQTAVWTFAEPNPANALVRQTWDGNAYVAAPYDPDYVNELMTPLPKGMSGVFVISETGGGFVEQTQMCSKPSVQKATRVIGMTTWYLCATNPTDPATYQRTMDSTLANPAITGVFIRLKWSDLQTGPNTFDDTILLREVDRAVAAGKLYSIGIKSGAENGATPTWLFDPAPAGAGLTEVVLDWSEGGAACNAKTHSYGNPTDPVYGQLYNDMLTHVASVLKQDSARWRSLAYVKISGANVRSAENKLPNGCAAGCICNNQVWANEGYTPNGLYAFYQGQMEHIEGKFPGKSMSYSLIQAGFPRVNNEGCYLDETNTKICPYGVNTNMVGPFAQTVAIINHARSEYGDDVAIAHLGLGPKPDYSDSSLYSAGCPVPLDLGGGFVHGANGVGSGCPNKWATDVGNVGGLTHFQTNNASGVATMAELDSALHNMWANSNSAMVEIYEARAWEANDSILDPTQPMAEQRTLADWNDRLHQRRRDDFPELGDPAPTTISFTFTRSIDPYETFRYFVPKNGPRPNSPVSPLLGYINLLY